MKTFFPALAVALGCSILSVTTFAADPANAPAAGTEALLKKYACIACHTTATKLVGPAYKDVAAKYHGVKDAGQTLAAKVKNGGSGVWGPIPMPPNPTVPDADLQAMIGFILAVK